MALKIEHEDAFTFRVCSSSFGLAKTWASNSSEDSYSEITKKTAFIQFQILPFFFFYVGPPK